MADTSLRSMEKIESLVGAEEFKARMRELASVIPVAVEKNIVSTLCSRNYLFSIDKGCGFSTCLELIKELLEESGKVSAAVYEGFLDGNGMATISQNVSGLKVSSADIVGLDISDWIGKLNMPEFRHALMSLVKRDDRTIFIFRIPPVEQSVMKKVHDAIYDIMLVTDVVFRPLTTDDCFEFASSVAAEKGFTLDDGAKERLDAKIAQEKVDGKFYGFDTVKKVVNEVIFNKMLNSSGDNVISGDDIGDVTLPEDKIRDPLDAFDNYIGMEGIKKQVSEIVSQIKYLRSKRGAAMPCIHMKFVGNPGTGKTTAARIVGDILGECGVLRNGAFFEYTARSLIGKHIGETEARTAEICRAAYGSVLFIDEAYSLSFSEQETRDFGNEALSVLVAEMENHRSDFVVIMAGYEEEMEQMMKANVGLDSRMPYKIVFDPYTGEELFAIFMKMVKDEFEYTGALESTAGDYFLSIPDEVTRRKDFSNARFVRNLYERCQRKALARCMGKTGGIVIDACDFEAAAADDDFKLDKKSAPVGF